MKQILILAYIFNFLNSAPELVIGEEKVSPGIVIIFEGAIKDHIMPEGMHLNENQTNFHIEARVNWDQTNIPSGAPPGGFVPYLYLNATIVNQKTGLQTFIDLLPHINLIDNFHYARNISLPGSIYDLYTVKFNVLAPTQIDLAIHKDWLDKFGEQLLLGKFFSYKNIYFGEICESIRD